MIFLEDKKVSLFDDTKVYFFSKDSQSILGISTLFAQGVVVTSNVESLINLFM